MAKSEQVMKNFSAEEEALLRGYLFTNPHGDDGFVYPNELIAGEELSPLMSAVSRTHVSMQDRTLSFLDAEKSEQTRAFLPFVREIVKLFRKSDGTLVTSRKTTNFNKEWVIAHGHASIKEGTAVFGHSENISDITIKKITGHPVNHPQVKSTRYISYKKVLDRALEDADITALPDAGKYVDYLGRFNQKYLGMTERLADLVAGTHHTKQLLEYLRQPDKVEAQVQKWVQNKQRIDDEYVPTDADLQKQRESVLKSLEDREARKEMGKFVLDYSRVYLTAANRTSGVYSVDARALEEIITDLISSPRIEDRARGQAIWDEAKKIAPVLLGERSHVKVDEWKVKNEREFRGYCEEKFGNLTPMPGALKHVNLLHPGNVGMYTDRFNAALAVFPYVDAPLLHIMDAMGDDDVKEVLAKAHQHRSGHDVIHPAIAHGGLVYELVMGYHGYRDMFRHRRGSRSTQLLTTRLGFEAPDIFIVFGLDKEYWADMEGAAELFEEARKTSPHAAEKLVPFGAHCRALHSWQVNQVGYMGKMRADIEKGNLSYVRVMREIIDETAKLMPETAKYFKVDSRDYPPQLWKKGYGWFDATQRK